MSHSIFLASTGSDLEATARDIGERFGWDLPHFIAQVISFSIVAFCLYQFAYKNILNMLGERR